jgi:hypothetical protein
MAEKFERREGEDPLLAYANSVPGTGCSKFGNFVREKMRGLLKEAAEMVENRGEE